jgi:hypothetical protein
MAEGRVRICSRDELEVWLADKDPSWAHVIAVRAALRVLPLLGMWEPQGEKGRAAFLELAIATFRSALVSHVSARAGIGETPVADARTAAAYVAAHAAADVVASRAIAARAASAYAAATAIDAIAAAATVANADPRATPWRDIEEDGAWLDGWNADALSPTHSLLKQPLWLSDVRSNPRYRANIPPWVRAPLDRLANDASLNEAGFGHWIEWYRELIPSRTGSVPTSYFGKELDLRIARQSDDWWRRPPAEVNADIAAWMEGEPEPEPEPEQARADWDFFLSYSTKDEVAARFIGDIIEAQGYRLFVQYKDMPPGSVFVNEMKRGLAAVTGSARFACVLSPDYEASGHCQTEWNAAYCADPTGEKRKIISFLVRKTKLNPLASGFVYTNLIGLDDDARRLAVIEAISGRPEDRASVRKQAAEAASPTIAINDRRTLDANAHPELDLPLNDEELPPVVERAIGRATGLIGRLDGNNRLAVLCAELKVYRDELVRDGVMPKLGVLKTSIEIIRAEVAEDGGNWSGSKANALAMSAFLADHDELIQFYPLDTRREQIFKNAPIDVEAVVLHELERDHSALFQATQDALDRDLVTQQLADVFEQQNRSVQHLNTLNTRGLRTRSNDPFLPQADGEAAKQARKRTLVRVAAIADKLTQVAANVSRVTGSEVGRQMIKAAGRVADYIWRYGGGDGGGGDGGGGWGG